MEGKVPIVSTNCVPRGSRGSRGLTLGAEIPIPTFSPFSLLPWFSVDHMKWTPRARGSPSSSSAGKGQRTVAHQSKGEREVRALGVAAGSLPFPTSPHPPPP